MVGAWPAGTPLICIGTEPHRQPSVPVDTLVSGLVVMEVVVVGMVVVVVVDVEVVDVGVVVVGVVVVRMVDVGVVIVGMVDVGMTAVWRTDGSGVENCRRLPTSTAYHERSMFWGLPCVDKSMGGWAGQAVTRQLLLMHRLGGACG